ncbi:hypothetical protein BDV96DRAFT_640238 [Lophiotrema nucula]|uniref:Rhodopsin domain-containing protein n=1 Tax=Lophiotrema nucula TaxID=690887 RepID=A0A6A5ZT53_9PLEO|nr:hypothetical protein BDV96DRAFT_640238 [Lophiotrema nucula]
MPQAQAAPPLIPLPHFSEDAFMGIVWGGFSIGTVLVAFRFGLRIKTFRQLFLEDAFVFFAWLIVFANAIMWQIIHGPMYLYPRVLRGWVMPPADFESKFEHFLKGTAAFIFLFYTSLWSIKLSFLFFFRRLYRHAIGRWAYFWWGIFALTVASWFVCIGDIEYDCLVKPLAEISTHCQGRKSINYQRHTLVANCVLDVVTDILITCIPITMLWKVRISTRRKLALGAVFCVTIITVTVAIIRVSVLSESGTSDMTWLYGWSNVEAGAALIVSCLGSFRSLFTSQDSNTKPSENAPPTIGSPKRKRLDSFARFLTDSLMKSESEPDKSLVEHETKSVNSSNYNDADSV